jgi:hypothetical protein
MNRAMRTPALCAALFMVGTLGSGCATVSVVSVAGEAAGDAQAAAASPEQQRLRASSDEFASHASEVGWADPDQGDGAARQALDVLLHGRGSAEQSDEARLTPAALFIEDRAYDIAESADVTASLAAEIREARIRVRAVNAAAAQVVLGPSRPAWSRRADVRAAETVVQLARRARAMFREVDDTVGERLSRDERDVVRRELDAFEVELTRLSSAADALSLADPDVELREVDVIAESPDVG